MTFCVLERDEMFGVKDLRAENARLQAENAALRARVAALEDRRGKQWENLLDYDGRPQRDNLGGPEDGGN